LASLDVISEQRTPPSLATWLIAGTVEAAATGVMAKKGSRN